MALPGRLKKQLAVARWLGVFEGTRPFQLSVLPLTGPV